MSASVSYRRRPPIREKLDYSAVSVFNDRALGKVNQTCDYDDHDNPIRCEMQVVDESVQPAVTRHYSIKKQYRLLLSRGLEQRLALRTMFLKVLMLEQAHANGIAVFAVDKELVNQLAFDHETEFAVDMDRFFFLYQQSDTAYTN